MFYGSIQRENILNFIKESLNYLNNAQEYFYDFTRNSNDNMIINMFRKQGNNNNLLMSACISDFKCAIVINDENPENEDFLEDNYYKNTIDISDKWREFLASEIEKNYGAVAAEEYSEDYLAFSDDVDSFNKLMKIAYHNTKTADFSKE